MFPPRYDVLGTQYLCTSVQNSDLDDTFRQNQCPDTRRVLYRTVLGLLGLVLIDVSRPVRATGT